MSSKGFRHPKGKNGKFPIIHPLNNSNARPERVSEDGHFSAPLSQRHLVKKLQLEKMPTSDIGFPYRPARYVPGAKCHISYYVYNVQLGRMARRRRFHEVLKNIPEEKREAWAKIQCKDVNEVLKEGFVEDANKKPVLQQEEKQYNVVQAMEFALKIKKAFFRDPSISSYNSITSIFTNWLKREKYDKRNPRLITRGIIQEFSDYLILERAISPNTRNNYISYISSLFGELKKREKNGKKIIKKNPASLEKLPEEKSTQNKAFSSTQVIELQELFLQNDPYMWMICQVIFYTFCRPEELRRIQVKNIDLKNKMINVPATMAKSRVEKKPEIPAPLETLLLEYLSQDKYLQDYYLFTRNKTPGPNQLGHNTIGNWHRKQLRKIITDPDLTLYSWKHTGNVAAYRAGVDIDSIRRQNGHKDITTTMIYLKSLGLLRNDEFRMKMSSLDDYLKL